MPFCPECKYEYVPGITTCPDCHVKLVDKLTEDKQSDTEWADLVRVAEYATLIDAEIAKVKLESVGIQCSLSGDIVDRVAGLGTLALGGIGVLVRQEDAERAREILASKE